MRMVNDSSVHPYLLLILLTYLNHMSSSVFPASHFFGANVQLQVIGVQLSLVKLETDVHVFISC